MVIVNSYGFFLINHIC